MYVEEILLRKDISLVGINQSTSLTFDKSHALQELITAHCKYCNPSYFSQKKTSQDVRLLGQTAETAQHLHVRRMSLTDLQFRDGINITDTAQGVRMGGSEEGGGGNGVHLHRRRYPPQLGVVARAPAAESAARRWPG